ncbi:MAG TPA: hypothetical protein ENK26_03980 [Gammaproteobacteria bacterium]|nr:hypothetical protein [Gammaproteobacteria bacterium]
MLRSELARLEPGKPVTIGKPLPTYSAMILAPGERRLLPFGEEGEIGIGGTGVAEGYLNRAGHCRKMAADRSLDSRQHSAVEPALFPFLAGEPVAVPQPHDLVPRLPDL